MRISDINIKSNTLHFALSAMLLTLIAASAQAQKVDKKKFELAERRARNAAKVLSDVTALPQSEGIPVELLTKAKAIAVFPDADKITMLFMKMMKGDWFRGGSQLAGPNPVFMDSRSSIVVGLKPRVAAPALSCSS